MLRDAFVRWSARAAARVALFAVCAAAPMVADAQYFGQNKVNYETFKFRTLQTPHFDLLYYPAESLATVDAARMAERWYTRLSPYFRHQFTERKTIVLFADAADFQQNNITLIEGEGTGGVTESFRQRVVMPHTGSYFDTHHVLGHELVHVFQYDIAEKQPSGGGRSVGLNALPLWLVEGMAEYLSLGRDDSNTSMWLRDAARRNDIPTIKKLTTDPRYFPYRYGQALWAYVGGRYGDQAVIDVYRSSLRYGFEGAIRRVLDVSTDQLSKDWAAAIKDAYLPLLPGRTTPDSTATMVIAQRSKRGSEYNVSPALSPDGRRMAFFSSRDLFGIEIYVADVETGRVIKQLGSVNNPRHYDALSFIQTAGSWAPDNRRFAYVAYDEGNQTIHVYDVEAGHEVRRLKTPGIGSAADPAWSPDGNTIAFIGTVGGISDVYLYDLATDRVTPLTSGREAELQPAWSPDGKTLAFVTDRGDGTDLDKLAFGPMRLATIDVATREIKLLPIPAPGAKSINPNYSSDGRSIYFVSDRTGFNDVYRLELATGTLSQVTRVQTGIIGVTSLSPALSVARGTNRMVFSVFDRQGNDIVRIDGDATRGFPPVVAGPLATALPSTTPGGTPTIVTTPPQPPVSGAAAAAAASGATNTPGTTSAAIAAPGGRLPPVTPRYASTIEGYLADAGTGLPTTTSDFVGHPYNGALHLDYIAPPSFGVQTGGFYGTQYGGGVAFGFSDQLGNKNLVTIVQAQGDIQDIGGQVVYQDVKHRWNYAGIVGRLPYITAYQQGFVDQSTSSFGVDQVLLRFYQDQIGGVISYPLSTIRRLELGVTGTRQSYRIDVYRYYLNNFGQVVAQDRIRPDVPKALYYTQGDVGLVGDYSIFGFTSPIAGGRYRFSVDPTLGQIQMTTATADYRRYFLARPVTFAFRGLHYGRYGRDSENQQILYPLYLGNPQFVRGYDYNSIDPTKECGATSSATTVTTCPVFDRLLGSRIAVASAELRIPLLGVEGLGLIHTNIIPVEIAPFVDAGVAWQSDAPARLRFVSGDEARNTPDRVPVVSAGISARINLFGYAVLETYYAYPFQRPDKKAHFGFQLAPGW